MSGATTFNRLSSSAPVRVGSPLPVRVPSPPPLKEMDPSYTIEIKAAVLDSESGHMLALKLQDLFAEWVGAHGNIPTERQCEMFLTEKRHSIEEFKRNPEKNYELIDPSELVQYRVIVEGDQILPFANPEKGPVRCQDEQQPMLFVIRYNFETKELELFVSQNQRHTHASFLLGQPVAAAGELYTSEGKIVKINNQSGHYRPEDPQTITIIEFMKRFQLSTPVMLETIARGAFCKGSILYSRLSLSPEAIARSKMEVRIGKIPEILLKHSQFKEYYERERSQIPESEFQQFCKEFLASTEWKKAQETLPMAPNEYMKRRFALISFASRCWKAKVKLI